MSGRRPRSRLTGPTTRSAALEAGLTDRQLQHPSVVRLSRDTYVPRALAEDADGRLAAVLMTAPEGSVASHLTAAGLWRIEVPLRDRDDRRVDLVVPAGSRAESRADRRVHRLPIAADEVTTWSGFPVTTPARTWRDLARVLGPAALLAVTDQLVLALVKPAELEEQLARYPRGRGAARARAVLPVTDERAGSPMESVLRWLIHGAGLPAPELQYAVRDREGRFLGRVDLAWPERKVLVEFDGDVHRERAVFVDDRRRQNALVAEGWTVLRFTSADTLGRPDAVLGDIRRALR